MEAERPPLSPKQHPSPRRALGIVAPAHTPPTHTPHSTGGAHPAPHPDTSPWLCLVSGHPTGLPAAGWGGPGRQWVDAGAVPLAQEGPHLWATLLQRTGFRLVHPGWDVYLGVEAAAASQEWHPMPWAPFRPAGHPHLQDDAHDWQVQGLPRHRGRPLVNLAAHCSPGGPGQEPALWKRPAKATESHSWPMRPSGCPNGHSPASRQGASLSKYSGAIRLSSAWNSRVKGRRDTSTRDCGPTPGEVTQPGRRGHPAGPERSPGHAGVCRALGLAHPESPRAVCSTSSQDSCPAGAQLGPQGY